MNRNLKHMFDEISTIHNLLDTNLKNQLEDDVSEVIHKYHSIYYNNHLQNKESLELNDDEKHIVICEESYAMIMKLITLCTLYSSMNQFEQ